MFTQHRTDSRTSTDVEVRLSVCNVIIRTKGQTPEQCKVIAIHDESDFIQCGVKN